MSQNQQLLQTIRSLQKKVHLCCELLPLVPNFKNMSGLMNILQTFTK